MTRDALTRMDVDTHWVTHRRWKRLQRTYPDGWPECAVAYFSLLGEAWSARNRDVNIEDAWPAALRADIAVVTFRLHEAGLIDSSGCIPAASWDEWYGPTERRINAGKVGAAARWQSQSDRNANSQPASTASQKVARTRGRTDGPKTAPVDMKAAMQAAGFDPDKLPDGGADKRG